MQRKEALELKKRLTPQDTTIQRLCGCYVDAEKNKKLIFSENLQLFSEEDSHKYLEILKTCLGGRIGRNLVNLDFPREAEEEGGTQSLLYAIKESKLENEELLARMYDLIIERYTCAGNYLILCAFDTYDVPGRAHDGLGLFDASEDIYSYLLTAICPVELSKPALSYHEEEKLFLNSRRDWIVQKPQTGFLFPAFNDRASDIHSVLYYSKNANSLNDSFIEDFFGCSAPLAAGTQKEAFNAITREALGDHCDFSSVRLLHEHLNDMVEENKKKEDPLVIDKYQLRTLLSSTGAKEDTLAAADTTMDEMAGSENIFAENIVNTRSFDIQTPDVVIRVNPDRTDLIESRDIDGVRSIVIRIDGDVEVNGIVLKE